MTLAASRNRRPPSRARTAAVALAPLLVLTYACLESAIIVAAGRLASLAGGLR